MVNTMAFLNGSVCTFSIQLRPSLSKKVFPVRRVTPKKASREVGIFFPSVFHFSLTRMTEKIEKKTTFFLKNKKKKFHPALFSPPGRWTGNHFLFKGGLIFDTEACLGLRELICQAYFSLHHLRCEGTSL